MNWMKNTWYQAGWDHEVKEGEILARRILNTPLVLFRNEAGEVSALHDMCPHRFAPLSMGVLEKGGLTCNYHGLSFNGSGKCTNNPHGPIVPALCVKSFPVVARHDALWIWMGDAEKADLEKIPDLGFIDATSPEARVEGYVFIEGDYRLMVENVLDLSHAEFLHRGSFGGTFFTTSNMEVTDDKDSVTISWTAIKQDIGPLMQKTLRLDEPLGDTRSTVKWSEPSILVQQSDFGPPGTIDNLPNKRTLTHIFTPETESTTHYFYSTMDDDIKANPGLKENLLRTLGQAFVTEDGPMIKGQQERMEGRDFWEMKPVLLPSDRAAAKFRRYLDRMIKAETAA